MWICLPFSCLASVFGATSVCVSGEVLRRCQKNLVPPGLFPNESVLPLSLSHALVLCLFAFVQAERWSCGQTPVRIPTGHLQPRFLRVNVIHVSGSPHYSSRKLDESTQVAEGGIGDKTHWGCTLNSCLRHKGPEFLTSSEKPGMHTYNWPGVSLRDSIWQQHPHKSWLACWIHPK